MERKIYVPKGSSRYVDNDKESPVQQSSSNGKKPKVISKEHNKEKKHYSVPQKNKKIEPHLHLLQEYQNIKWDSLELNELYAEFKEIEKHLKSMIETDCKQCLNVVSDFGTLRGYFLDVWERIIFQDTTFACGKEIDKRLGAIIKKPIELLNKEKNKDEDFRKKVLKQIEDDIEVLKGLIQKMSSKLDLENTPMTEDNVIRKMTSNLISYLGELFQIREKGESPNPNLSVPVNLYFKAMGIYPHEGKYFMLISNCSKVSNDLFGAIYWGIRGYCCMHYYPLNEQLLRYLEESRKAYLTMLENEWLDVRNVELFKYFILAFLRYTNIILTKIGFEELYSVTNKMFEYYQKYLNYLSNDDFQNFKPNEGGMLQQTILLLVYTLYHSVQGYNPKDELGEKYKEAQVKSFTELMGSDLINNCLKNSYGILYHLVDFVAKTPEDYLMLALNALSPALYYLVGYKFVGDFLLANYKQLKDKMIFLNKRLSNLYLKNCEKFQISNEDIQTFLDDHYFLSDKLVFGFVPLASYFSKEQTYHKRPMPQEKEKVFLAKVKDTICNLDFLGCRVHKKEDTDIETGDKEAKKDLFDLDGILGKGADSAAENQAHLFHDMAFNKENKEKRLILIDGQNVAIRHGDVKFSSMGLKLVIDFWVEKGHQVHVLLPDYYFKKEEVATKKQLAINKGESLKHIPDNVDILLELKAKGYAFGIPNWNYDDSYIIDYAKKKNAFIITNDRYNDHIKNYSKNDPHKKEKLREWIRNNCISFTFINDEFIPDPDFLNTHMK